MVVVGALGGLHFGLAVAGILTTEGPMAWPAIQPLGRRRIHGWHLVNEMDVEVVDGRRGTPVTECVVKIKLGCVRWAGWHTGGGWAGTRDG